MKRRKLALVSALTACLVLAALTAGSVLAQSGNIWHIDYYPNTNWSGNPVFSQDAPMLWFDWGYGSPGPNVPADNFTARMTTDAFFYSGIYQFTVQADDDVLLLVDGATYLDTRGAGQSGKVFGVSVPMTQSNHRIQVDYREFTELAYIYLNWAYVGSGGGNPPPPVNPEYPNVPPLPASASSVQTRFGDYTPCIQQGIHQVNCFVSDGQWNSPNEGSIASEPPIQVWGNCANEQVQSFLDPATQKPKDYKCSKTEAGWFPN